jgi:predicted O-methyltransferase YrrM
MSLKRSLRLAANRLLRARRIAIERLPDDAVDIGALDSHFFARRYECQGIDWQEDGQRALLKAAGAFADNFAAWPRQPDPAQPEGYWLANEYFGPVDAEIYYTLLRSQPPATVIEIGNGFSTRLARRAIRDGALRTRICCADPSPRAGIETVADEHWKQPVQTLELARFDRLEPGDFLFIDSSHRIETGGDLPFLLLEVLPRLRPGVRVHFHDIHLPGEYPRHWVQDQRRNYSEQYAVGAMLAFNPRYRVRWASAFMMDRHAEAVRRSIPSAGFGLPALPGSLWLELQG